jgi:hypothetical protein
MAILKNRLLLIVIAVVAAFVAWNISVPYLQR